MAADEEVYAIIEERDAEMVPFLNSKETIYRKGYFLKPISGSSSFSFSSSFVSPEKAIENQKIQFKGWASLTNWEQWIKKLKPSYKELWEKVGILDAINVSIFKFHRDPASFFGVCRFWCGETNTFLFPWGETTVTLEDVMILGGFSVLGECVLTSKNLEGDLLELEAEILLEVRKFNKTKNKKATSSVWMKHFLEKGNCDELEHIAFLTLWLTHFVLPSHPFKTIRKKVIPLAIRLARGVRIALAPAVLASIYRDMREIKAYLCSNEDRQPLDVWAPFHILQLWVWERFSGLQPESLFFVNSHEPRGARWCDMSVKLAENYVLSIIRSRDEVEWRPYLANLDHWCKPTYYRSDGRWIYEVVDEGIASYIRCLKACELVGLDCIEQYLPNRVARQFGYDQEIPCIFPRAYSKWEIAWQTYEFDVSNIKLYIPPKLFKSDVTLEYLEWWNNVQKPVREKIKLKKKKKGLPLRSCVDKKLEEVMDKEEEIDEIPLSLLLSYKKKKLHSLPICSCVDKKLEEVMDKEEEIDEIPLSVLSSYKKKKLSGCSDVSLHSLRACENKKMNNGVYDKLGTTSGWLDMNSSSKISEPQTSTENLEKCMELEPSSKVEERLVISNPIENENNHACESKISLESQDITKCEVTVSSDSIETIDRDGYVSDSEGEIEEISAAETVYEPEVENDESQDEKIRKLKEEIAIIHAKVMELEAKEAGGKPAGAVKPPLVHLARLLTFVVRNEYYEYYFYCGKF